MQCVVADPWYPHWVIVKVTSTHELNTEHAFALLDIACI